MSMPSSTRPLAPVLGGGSVNSDSISSALSRVVDVATLDITSSKSSGECCRANAARFFSRRKTACFWTSMG